MKKIMIVSAMLGCLVLAACKSSPKQTYYDSTFDEAESDSNEAAGETAASFEDQPGEIISVPYEERGNVKYVTRVRDKILKSKEQKTIQPTKGGHKMVTYQNDVRLFYCQITSCPSEGGIS